MVQLACMSWNVLSQNMKPNCKYRLERKSWPCILVRGNQSVRNQPVTRPHGLQLSIASRWKVSLPPGRRRFPTKSVDYKENTGFKNKMDFSVFATTFLKGEYFQSASGGCTRIAGRHSRMLRRMLLNLIYYSDQLIQNLCNVYPSEGIGQSIVLVDKSFWHKKRARSLQPMRRAYVRDLLCEGTYGISAAS